MMDGVRGLHDCGFKCDFISKPDDHFYCNCCKCVARKPTITSCCGRCFCADCIEPVREKGDPCLYCGNKISQTMVQNFYQEMISNMKVKCTHRAKGCQWEGPLKELENHLDESKDECMYAEVLCHKGCGFKVEKGLVEIHLNSVCAERHYVCQYCNEQGTYRSISEEHWPECEYKPVQCPNMCGVACEQSVLIEHSEACLLSTISCSYQSAGCNATFHRKDEDDHMKESMQCHLDLTMNMCQELTKKCQETKILCERGLQEQAEEFSEKLRALQRDQAEQYQQHEEKLHALYRECEHKLCTMKQRFEMVLHGKNESLKALKVSTKDAIDACVKQAMESFRLKTGLLPYILLAKDYQQLKANNAIWYSPDMVTHPGGYTFLITVRPNGFGDTLNKSVGVWLRCVKGLYDHRLAWPAKVTVTLELLNQLGDHDHIINTNLFELQQLSGDDPTVRHHCVDAFSYNCILHEDLKYNEGKRTQYLKEDCLTFRVTSITVN